MECFIYPLKYIIQPPALLVFTVLLCIFSNVTLCIREKQKSSINYEKSKSSDLATIVLCNDLFL